MNIIYRAALCGYYLLIVCASPFNNKAKLWIAGRKNFFQKIRIQVPEGDKKAWFHFASLGEFEQGRPVLEAFKRTFPAYRIIITFFSPSGYEIRKDYSGTDLVTYLPLDTPGNAKKFIELIKPDIVFFTKYEYWYYYFRELNRLQIPLFMISAIFRHDQPFFKWYGTLHRQMLRYVSYFFLQDQRSAELLGSLGIKNCLVSGDTRFDRVSDNLQATKEVEKISTFKGADNIFIAGSTWPEDEELLLKLITETNTGWKYIIAPHEISATRISAFRNKLPVSSVCYSELHPDDKSAVLIIDNIGLLAHLYAYAGIAYIGGGFGKGIHNILEAAVSGIPVIFGPNYKKFREATDLVRLGGAFSISNYSGLLQTVRIFMQDSEKRDTAGAICKRYTFQHTGATRVILEKIGLFINKEQVV